MSNSPNPPAALEKSAPGRGGEFNVFYNAVLKKTTLIF